MPHRVPALCILLASLILTSSLAAGAIYTVDGGGTGDYLTIGEALAVSSGGDVIQVFPGTYSENLTIGQAITLESTMGSALTTIVGAVTTSDVITITVDGVSIDGFTVTGGRYGLFLNAALTTITFNDCIVEETGSLPVSLPAQLVGSVIPTLTLVPHASGQYDGVNVTTGTIGSSVTWPVLTPGFVYYLSSVTVSVVGASGPVLTIPTGTIVKSWFSRFEIGSATLPGGLVADGVTFTSARDDIGGDTDGSALAPGAAEWQRLDFNAMARADSCLITNCDFYYGGSGTGAIQVAGSEPLINGCTFTDNAGAIYVTSSSGDGSTLVGNVINQGDYLPLGTTIDCLDNLVFGNTIVPRGDDVYNGIRLYNSTVTTSRSLPTLPYGFNYYMESVTINVVGASGPVLTIDPGLVIKMWFSRFEIGSASLPGGLVADGVTFTSARDDINGDTNGAAYAPGAGQWQRLDFNAMARADSCLITNCDILYGGSGTGAIQVAGSEPLINGCTFTDNAGAIYVTSSTGDGSTFVGNTINQGDYLPLGTTIDCLDNLVFGNTIVPRGDDVFNGIRLYNSTVTTSTTLQTLPHDFVYYMESVTISVVGPAAPVLTIATGSIVKMWFSRFEIASASDPGGLMADSVTFTSARDDVGGDTNGATYAPGPGQWSRIDFNPLAPADDCLLENCTFRYGGNGQGTVETNDCSPRLRECLIEQSSTSGLYTRGEDAYPSLWFCTLSDNNVGVLANYQGQAHIVRCCIEGNATYGVEVAAGSGHVASVDARNCWWGAADGPSGEGPGSGDAVTTVVRYDPWYTIPACSDMPSGIELPERFTLEGAYPNPFNPQTVIAFALPADLPVTVDVYTVDGQRVARLAEGLMNAGPCEVIWHGRNDAGRSVPSGVYLYRVQAGDEVLAGKMMMLK